MVGNRHDVRWSTIMGEAARLESMAAHYEAMVDWPEEYIANNRDVYRDMAAVLRLLADERGT